MATPSSPIVYVALGSRRITAARHYAAGALLVVANRPEWADTEGVHRLEAKDPEKALAEARKLLLDRNGPLRDATMLVLGDPESAPLSHAVRRRFPSLDVRLTPTDGDRRTAAADLVVVTPWYPSPNDPFAGAFVQAATAAVGDGAGRVVTLHGENWFYSPKGIDGKEAGVAVAREVARTGGVTVEDTDEGELTRVVVPQVTNGTYVSRTAAQIERIKAALPGGRIDAPLVHAHTGHYAGVVATALAGKDAKLVVSEHATFLADIFADAPARKRYRAMLARADRVLCVSGSLRDQIAQTFPDKADKLQVVPNPIDFDRFVRRAEPPTAPRRWLYVGRMVDHKGVHTLLDAFAQVAAEDPEVTLTLVGSGPMQRDLGKRIAKLGLTGRVEQRAAVRPEEVAGLMSEHDVLTHASRTETFGVTLIEAIATGTPVLAARSAGPAETLEGLDGVAGVLFEPTEDPAVIVAAYRRLRDSWDRLDLPAARERLLSRYGKEAVGAQLLEVYRQVLADSPAPAKVAAPVAESPTFPASDGDRYVIVAIDKNRTVRVTKFIDAARGQGCGVDLITLDPGLYTKFKNDPGVRVFDLSQAEERWIGRRLEQAVLTKAPRRLLGLSRARAKGMSSTRPEAVLAHAQHAHGVLAGKIDGKFYRPWYSVVRPRVLWAITRRQVLPQLDLSRTRRVVVHGMHGVTIGWGLARGKRNIPVDTDVLRLPVDPAEREAVSS